MCEKVLWSVGHVELFWNPRRVGILRWGLQKYQYHLNLFTCTKVVFLVIVCDELIDIGDHLEVKD